jgi:SAM-dependent methyltransferase
MNTKKKILDAACGPRMFWFDKHHPNALYIDNRKELSGFVAIRPNKTIEPDEIQDFRNMPYEDGAFKLVVWDPPHILRRNASGKYLTRVYGVLHTDTWKEDLRKGFSECWRVLAEDGVLIFKWAETDRKLKDILPLFSAKPLFGNRTTSNGRTHWLCFMKIK